MAKGRNRYFENYPKDQLYRLVVDGVLLHKEKGFEAYDKREQGCVSNALKGIAHAILRLQNEDLSVDLVTSVAAICMNADHFEKHKLAPGQLRYKGGPHDLTFFDIRRDKISIQGLEEFISLHRQSDHPEYLGYIVAKNSKNIHPLGKALPVEGQTLGNCESSPGTSHHDLTVEKLFSRESEAEEGPSEKQRIDTVISTSALAAKYLEMVANKEPVWTITYVAPDSSIVNEAMGYIVESYNHEIGAATNKEEKLRVIAKHIQLFERLHPLYDANGRVFVNSLLNAMLYKEKFPPATFTDPNIFDFLSVEEIVKKIEEAMKNSKNIINKPQKEHDGFNARDVSPEGLKSIKNGLDQLASTIDNLSKKSHGQAKDKNKNKSDEKEDEKGYIPQSAFKAFCQHTRERLSPKSDENLDESHSSSNSYN